MSKVQLLTPLIMSLLLFCVPFAHGKPSDITATIDYVVEVTKRKLALLEEVKHLMTRLEEVKEEFLLTDMDKGSALQMVNISQALLLHLEAEHLQHLVTPDYLSELRFLSSFSQKKTIVLP